LSGLGSKRSCQTPCQGLHTFMRRFAGTAAKKTGLPPPVDFYPPESRYRFLGERQEYRSRIRQNAGLGFARILANAATDCIFPQTGLIYLLDSPPQPAATLCRGERFSRT